jgi:hypothetical protein
VSRSDKAASTEQRGRLTPRQSGEINLSEQASGMARGFFVISLDFEQAWGIRHLPAVSRYLPRLIGTRSAVLSLLDMFRHYGIHATWAVVGFLFADNGARLQTYLPASKPQYAEAKLSPYHNLPPSHLVETNEPIFFAPTLIKRIQASPHQEIGTHTLSHYYCLEPGQDSDAFKADLEGAIHVARDFGLELRSLVFPKNQCRADYLKVCADAGIVAYRGNPKSILYRANPDHKQQTPLRRFGRLLDAYLPISSSSCKSLPLKDTELPITVPASRFLRPYMPTLRLFEPLRLWRVKHEMTYAAANGLLYHLWFHPHDFGTNTQSNLQFLRGILDHYLTLKALYGFQSVSMAEAAAAITHRELPCGAATRQPIYSTGPSLRRRSSYFDALVKSL